MPGPMEIIRELGRRVDRFFAAARRRNPGALRCGPGCGDCCHRSLELLPIEVRRLVAAARRLPGEDRARILRAARRARRDPQAPCPLLRDGRCQTYVSRPVVCRCHGLPLRVTVGHKHELSLCPYNFPGLSCAGESCVLDLAPVNQLLKEANHRACAHAGEDPAPVPLAAALIAGLRGRSRPRADRRRRP